VIAAIDLAPVIAGAVVAITRKEIKGIRRNRQKRNSASFHRLSSEDGGWLGLFD